LGEDIGLSLICYILFAAMSILSDFRLRLFLKYDDNSKILITLLTILTVVKKLSKVRDGITIKVRKEVHAKLIKVVGRYASKYGRKITYSDVIMALLKNVPDPVKAIEEYVKEKTKVIKQ